jgi:7-carboxy-7-deazaguanine synthase
MSAIRISEIFGPTVQGEGALIGKPTVFVRTGGCDFRCRWCDTLFAVLPEYRHQWAPMTPEEILARVEQLTGGRPVLVTLSGGNPAIHPLGQLIALGKGRHHRFAMETQGSVAADWFASLDWLVLSPKPPSSGMSTDWVAFDACLGAAASGPQTVLKIVVFDDADYDYARAAAARYPLLRLYLSVGNHTPGEPNEAGRRGVDQAGLLARFRWLADKVARDRWFEATVLPQLHVLVWGNERGV